MARGRFGDKLLSCHQMPSNECSLWVFLKAMAMRAVFIHGRELGFQFFIVESADGNVEEGNFDGVRYRRADQLSRT